MIACDDGPRIAVSAGAREQARLHLIQELGDASSCAGTSKKDAQTDAWIAVPKGTCDKIVGGKLSAG